MEVLLDFQDGGVLELGGFEIDITQDYLRPGGSISTSFVRGCVATGLEN